MVHEKYKDIGSLTIKLIEECSELIHILCEAERFGINNYHPELIRREMSDVVKAISELKKLHL